MSRINLLPWREDLRALQKRQFFQVLGVSVASIIFLAFIIYYGLQYRISHQQQRNVIAQQQLAQLVNQVKAVQILQQQTQQLHERLQVINKAHVKSVQRAQLFDELARVIPHNLFLTKLHCIGNELNLAGLTESNAEVATFTHQLAGIKGVHHPKLSEMKISQESELYRYSFTIKAKVS